MSPRSRPELPPFEATIGDVAQLALECLPAIEDFGLGPDGARTDSSAVAEDIYYAVDSDTVRFYLRPDERLNYSQVFPDDETTTRILAVLLVEFLFGQPYIAALGAQQPDCRFLVIPPHDLEILNNVQEVRSQGPAALDQGSLSVVDALRRDWRSAFAESDQAPSLLLNILAFYHPYVGSLAQVRRVQDLGANQLMRMDLFNRDGLVMPMLWQEQIPPDSISSGWLRDFPPREFAFQRQNFWYGRLRNRGTRQRLNDAEVLATLEWANTKLPTGKRLVLVTGSADLHRATRDHVSEGFTERTTFEDAYLRYPKAFLAHQLFFSTASADPAVARDSGFAVQDFILARWLSILLTEAASNTTKVPWLDRARLMDLTQSKKRHRPIAELLSESARLREFWASWETAIAETARSRFWVAAMALAAKVKDEPVAADGDMTGTESFVDTQHNIQAHARALVNELYDRTATIGVWADASAGDFNAPPPLICTECPTFATAGRAAVRLQLQTLHGRTRDGSEDTWRRRLEEFDFLMRRVEGDDPTLYYSHTIHSLAFMTKGLWSASLTLASIALSVADGANGAGYATGREAAFLASLAARRLANSAERLIPARTYIAQAQMLETPGTTVVDPRFRAVRLSILVRRFYFSWFVDRVNVREVDYNRVLRSYGSLIEEVAAADVDPNDEMNAYATHWILRSCLTDWFSLTVCGEVKYPGARGNEMQRSRMCSLFEAIFKDEARFGLDSKLIDPYAETMRHAARILCNSAVDRPHVLRAMRANVKGLQDRPYDKERNHLVLNWARERLAKP